MNKKKIWIIGGGIFTVVGSIGVLIWFNNCMDMIQEDPNIDSFQECIYGSPPIQEVQELAEKCDETDLECVFALGKKVIENKAESDLE